MPEPTPSDLRLTAERIRAGDTSAYDAFLKDQWPSLVRYLFTFVHNTDDAKDIAQEAFARLWEQRSGIKPDSSIRAYLYQIARNQAINELRTRERHHRLNVQHAEEHAPVRTPARELETEELRQVVEHAIEALPERRREAFILAHLQSMPHREIAEFMGISLNTVGNQVSSALAQLREALAPYIKEPNGDDLRRSG